MARVREYLVARTHLHDLAQIHHGDAVGAVLYHGHVVRNEKISDAEFALQILQQRSTRAVERGETKGFMKIVADAETKEILGAALLGASGDEVVHGILDMIYAGEPYTVMQRVVPIHPTVSELLPTVLADMKPVG